MSTKKQVTLRLREDHVSKINEWRERQQVQPSFAAAIDQAIAQFVDGLDGEEPPTIARGMDASDELDEIKSLVSDLEDRLARLKEGQGS